MFPIICILLNLPLWPILLLVIFSVLIYMFLVDISTILRLPKGPTPFPLFGNALQIPKEPPLWRTLTSWSEKYGPIFTLYLCRTPALIISDPHIAHELLAGRSAKYSSRPRMVMFGEVYSQMSSVVVQPYGQSWSMRRKLFHQALNPQAVATYAARQEAEASKAAWQILQNPERWLDCISRFTASIVFSVGYGRRIDSLAADVVVKRRQWIEYIGYLMAPGNFLAETFPFLASLPDFLTPWKVEVRERGNIEAAHNISLVNSVKADISLALKTGTETPSSLTKLMLQWKDAGAKGMDFLTERWFAAVPGTLFGAGSDTSAATLSSVIFALVAYPHILKILQAELDAHLSIFSPDARSPTLSDREKGKLPYLTALITETLRWRPAAPFGISHATSEADTYNGFYIPPKTTVIANSWAINNNPLYFPFPESFAPERYLPKSDPRYNPELEGEDFPGKYKHSTFGWGRRQCAGADLAVTSMWILIGKLCWAFEILPVEGEVYDADAFVAGFVLRPKPFGLQIKIRSEAHRRVLEREMKEAGEYLEMFPPFV